MEHSMCISHSFIATGSMASSAIFRHQEYCCRMCDSPFYIWSPSAENACHPRGSANPCRIDRAPELILSHDIWSSTVGPHTVQDCTYVCSASGVIRFKGSFASIGWPNHLAFNYITSSRLSLTRTLTSTRRLSSRPTTSVLLASRWVLP